MKHLLPCLFGLALLACAPVEKNPFAAVDSNDVRSLRSYLDRGGSPDARTSNGESLLYIATGPHGGEDVLRLLLERGARPDAGAAGGYTPLMNAASWCWLQGVSMLVKAGADVHARNSRGETAMQTVCSGRDANSVVAYLRDHGLQAEGDAATAPTLAQPPPEPRPTRAVVMSVDRPTVHDATFEAYAVVVVIEEGGANKLTVYLPDSPNLPKQGQHCEFNLAPVFPSGFVGREFWSQERGKLTGALGYQCETGK